MRYRFFPARLGSICREPFEGEIGSDKTKGSPAPLRANTTQRRRRGSRRELKGSNTMAYETVNPYGQPRSGHV
jgi:hypothetical protein